MHNRRASTSISGWINGFIGVAIFSGSLPATRIAVQEFDPFFLTFCRGAIAGVLALGLIWFLRLPRPQAGQWRSLALAALLLHESVSPLMVVVTLGIIFCVIGSKRFAR